MTITTLRSSRWPPCLRRLLPSFAGNQDVASVTENSGRITATYISMPHAYARRPAATGWLGLAPRISSSMVEAGPGLVISAFPVPPCLGLEMCAAAGRKTCCAFWRCCAAPSELDVAAEPIRLRRVNRSSHVATGDRRGATTRIALILLALATARRPPGARHRRGHVAATTTMAAHTTQRRTIPQQPAAGRHAVVATPTPSLDTLARVLEEPASTSPGTRATPPADTRNRPRRGRRRSRRARTTARRARRGTAPAGTDGASRDSPPRPVPMRRVVARVRHMRRVLAARARGRRAASGARAPPAARTAAACPRDGRDHRARPPAAERGEPVEPQPGARAPHIAQHESDLARTARRRCRR